MRGALNKQKDLGVNVYMEAMGRETIQKEATGGKMVSSASGRKELTQNG